MILTFLLSSLVLVSAYERHHRALDAIPPSPLDDEYLMVDVCIDPEFKCKWVMANGDIEEEIPDEEKPNNLEVAATVLISEYDHQVGTESIQLMVRNMPTELYQQLAARGRVGLFTYEDKSTIYPEYAHMRDTPECAGRCDGSCAVTCTGDGRKWDSVAGMGGVRGTCLDDNYMCTPQDPYAKTDNILIHEFAHTVHMYGLPYVPGDVYDRVRSAWLNARSQGIWTAGSYAMANEFEYFAEATGVFFNVNHHWSSTGGMNSCGKSSGFCDCPEDAREWLEFKDPQLYDILVYTYTDGTDTLPGELHICMTEPNNVDCDLM